MFFDAHIVYLVILLYKQKNYEKGLDIRCEV
nr:MAG TPA: hypothetical protein [Caudoviricetes sp.]